MSGIVKYFFDAYFHQDWREDYSSSLDAVQAFAMGEPPESVDQLVQAFGELQRKGDLPQATIHSLGGNFRPASEGMSVAAWVRRALEVLEGKQV